MTQDEIVARNVFKVRLFIDAWQAIAPVCVSLNTGQDILMRTERQHGF